MFFSIISLFLSCASARDIRRTASLVTINEVVMRCETPNNCIPTTLIATGTGTRIIWENKYYWLTAGHVCAAGESFGMQSIASSITFTVGGTSDIESITHTVYDAKKDLCIAKAKKGPARNIAKVEPKLASRITAIAYPKGVFDHRLQPVYEGRWSGHYENKCVITIPVTGGSSGAGVINENGQLVGVITAVEKDFNHFTIITCPEDINEFLKSSVLQLENLDELKAQNVGPL